MPNKAAADAAPAVVARLSIFAPAVYPSTWKANSSAPTSPLGGRNSPTTEVLKSIDVLTDNNAGSKAGNISYAFPSRNR
ncbi:hypothetical protein HK405_015853 [Cladochytrium tenue]|nr:hypothetical protein HK405_015853 [Cladochytrium tenue]